MRVPLPAGQDDSFSSFINLVTVPVLHRRRYRVDLIWVVRVRRTLRSRMKRLHSRKSSPPEIAVNRTARGSEITHQAAHERIAPRPSGPPRFAQRIGRANEPSPSDRQNRARASRFLMIDVLGPSLWIFFRRRTHCLPAVNWLRFAVVEHKKPSRRGSSRSKSFSAMFKPQVHRVGTTISGGASDRAHDAGRGAMLASSTNGVGPVRLRQLGRKGLEHASSSLGCGGCSCSPRIRPTVKNVFPAQNLRRQGSIRCRRYGRGTSRKIISTTPISLTGLKKPRPRRPWLAEPPAGAGFSPWGF